MKMVQVNKIRVLESIGIDELEEPLISLGIAESREDVKKLIYTVDDDGFIEFKEFLEIIKNKNGDGKSNSKETMVIDFFKGKIYIYKIRHDKWSFRTW